MDISLGVQVRPQGTVEGLPLLVTGRSCCFSACLRSPEATAYVSSAAEGRRAWGEPGCLAFQKSSQMAGPTALLLRSVLTSEARSVRPSDGDAVFVGVTDGLGTPSSM